MTKRLRAMIDAENARRGKSYPQIGAITTFTRGFGQKHDLRIAEIVNVDGGVSSLCLASVPAFSKYLQANRFTGAVQVKPGTLKIVKTQPARVTWGDYGMIQPGLGDWSNHIPAVYEVTGPSGRVYTVTGSPSSFMRRGEWWHECPDHDAEDQGGFDTRAACLAAIAKLEEANAAQQV